MGNTHGTHPAATLSETCTPCSPMGLTVFRRRGQYHLVVQTQMYTKNLQPVSEASLFSSLSLLSPGLYLPFLQSCEHREALFTSSVMSLLVLFCNSWFRIFIFLLCNKVYILGVAVSLSSFICLKFYKAFSGCLLDSFVKSIIFVKLHFSAALVRIAWHYVHLISKVSIRTDTFQQHLLWREEKPVFSISAKECIFAKPRPIAVIHCRSTDWLLLLGFTSLPLKIPDTITHA